MGWDDGWLIFSTGVLGVVEKQASHAIGKGRGALLREWRCGMKLCRRTEEMKMR